MGGGDETLRSVTDPQTMFINFCRSLPDEKAVIIGSQRV